MSKRLSKHNHLHTAIMSQIKWIADHGATRAGYIARYGSQSDANHYGDGGEAIYAADAAALHRLLVEAGYVS